MRKNNKSKNITDKISNISKKTVSVTVKGKKYSVAPVKAAVFVAAFIIIVCFIWNAIFTGRNAQNIDISFETGNGYNAVSAEDSVILYNNRGASAVAANGKTKWQIQEELSEPLLEIADEFVLLADLAGNHRAASYKNGTLHKEYILGNDIISAKITANGCAAFATDTDGYKAKVTVFNKRGREIYAWNSGSGYVTDIELSENGRYLIAAQLVTDGEEAVTRLQFIDTSRGEVINSIERTGEVCSELRFVDDNRLIYISDSHIAGYTKKGKQRFEVSLVGKTPSLYDIGKKGIAVATVDGRGNTVLELYSLSGRLRGSYLVTGDVRTLAADGRGAVFAEQSGITRVNVSGKVRGFIKPEHDIGDIGVYSGGRILAVGANYAEVITLK